MANANMEKAPILSARDVEIQFSLRGKKLKAIRKCSLDLYQGETLRDRGRVWIRQIGIYKVLSRHA
ncbi:MAG: hypothetical protein V8S27_08700 [Lachnospiraceae bacterium]